MNLAHRKNFRAVKMRPADLEPALPSVLAALKPSDELQFARRYAHLPLVCVIVDPSGLPVVGPSLFLAACAIKSRGVTGDTPSTYGDCVLDWIRYLDAHGKTLASATEETLQLYRSSGFRAKGVTSATANLRIAVVVQLHTWSQRNGFPSPLGRYLLERDRNDRSLAPRVIGRHPRVMSLEELQRIFGLTTLVFRLAFRWCVTAGLRRFEVAGLTSDLLPPPESLPFCEDGIVKFDLIRKGGKQVPIYAPLGLVEETQWFLITDRMESQPGYENHIFINQRGFPLSGQSLSKEFRRCANLIGSDATLHHLRHTFAVNLLKLVEACAKKTPEINALKIVQVLMGHSSSATTETYLRAMEVSSAAVRDALDYLYGATL